MLDFHIISHILSTRETIITNPVNFRLQIFVGFDFGDGLEAQTSIAGISDRLTSPPLGFRV